MKKYFILLFVLFSMGVYAAPLTISNQKIFHAVQQQLASADNLSGHFTQTRDIKLLSSPLKSEGNFILSKSKGLSWNQTQPFKSQLTVTADKLTQQIGDNPPITLTKEQQPIVFFFTQTFLSVFKGDTKALTPYFNIGFSGDQKNWQIRLAAKTAPLNKAITQIELSGGNYFNSAVISEATGDKLTIHFRHIKVLP